MKRLSDLLRAGFSVVLALSFSLQGMQTAVAQDGGEPRIARNTQTGKVSFIGAPAGRPISVPAARAAGLGQRERALAMIQPYAADFGLKNPSRELEQLTSRSEKSREITHFRQIYKGVPVMAGELVVNATHQGAFHSINGEIAPDLNLDVNPTITSEQARQAALQAVTRIHGGNADEYSASEPELWIYDSRLLQPDGTQPGLVWRTDVRGTNSAAPINELVLIDAQRGNVRLNFNQIDTSWSAIGGRRPALKRSTVPNRRNEFKLATTNNAPPRLKPPASLGTGSGDRYVSTTGSDTTDCTDPVTPCLTINYAMGQANGGETIKVAEGVYDPVDTEPMAWFTKDLILSGGWDSTFTSVNGASVLNAQDDVNYVVYINGFISATMDNFIIRNGGIGIFAQSPLTLRNSQISGNSGPGVYLYPNSNLILINSTITGNSSNSNGGGIYNRTSGTVVVRNSIIANNSAKTAGPDCYGTIDSSDHNIIGDITDCIVTAGPGDLLNIDPLLSTYPVGTTGYYTLQSGSPAIGAGDNTTCIEIDIRGMSRPMDVTCDIGAYEYVSSPGPTEKTGIVIGDSQRSAKYTPFPKPLGVYVLDSMGSAVGDVDVTFTAPETGASGTFEDSVTNMTTVSTDSSGLALTPSFTSNGELGSYIVAASVDGIGTPLEFNLTNVEWYVATSGNDGNSCNDPAYPCLTINAAINKIVPGDTIKVAVGTYHGSSSPVVLINREVVLSGGWDTTFNSRIGSSIIDGQQQHVGVSIGAYPNIDVLIENFTVRNGTRGISSSGLLTLRNSTITGNVSSVAGGGIYITDVGRLTLQNSTIANNQAPNGGGIAASQLTGPNVIQNSILANNTATTSGPDCYGTVHSSDHNVISDTSGCTVTADPSDQLDVDALISAFPVGEYGYHTLLSGSPAIEAGDNATCLAADQRGMSRPQDTNCDAGSYEYVAPLGTADSFGIANGSNQSAAANHTFSEALAVYVVDNLGSPIPSVEVTFTAPNSGASGSFTDTHSFSTTATTDSSGLAVAAILTANFISGDYFVNATADGLVDVVQFSLINRAWYVSPTGNDSDSCEIPTAPCLTIQSAVDKASSGDVILVASGTYTQGTTSVVVLHKGLDITGGWNASFSNQIGLSIIDGQNVRRGVDIWSNTGPISLDRFMIQNGNESYGGAINVSGKLTLTNSSLHDNQADDGSGIYTYGTVIIRNSTISNNKGRGAIQAGPGTTLTVENSTIVHNRGTTGGLVDETSGTITLKNTILAHNVSVAGVGPDCSGTINTSDHNIIGNTTGCTVVPGPGDLFNVDPKLSLYLDELGYYLPMPDSPAMEAGNPASCLDEDQRGIPRPQDTTCEIGAIELAGGGTTPAVHLALLGTPQFTRPGHVAATPLSTILMDAQGYGVAGVDVTFTAPESEASGTFADGGTNSTIASTNLHGIATASDFTTNAAYGSYVVEAATGAIPEAVQFELGNSPPVEIYDMNNAAEPLPGAFICDEGIAACTQGIDAHADGALTNAIGAVLFYGSHFGRQSLDDAGMTVIASVHYGSGYDDAFWSGTQMVYGDANGWPLADDVVAHELTHAVTQYESGLFYYYQSGAISESLSDFFGEIFDQENGRGDDTPAVKWLLGEDISGLGVSRSMSDPPAYGGLGEAPYLGDPDKITSPLYYPGDIDNGSVHINNGVNNKAAYLLVDGGTFNNRTITALGVDKSLALYYEAQVNLLTSGSDYSDLYNLLQQACLNLIGGAEGITSADCQEVQDAVDAVEMNAQPVTGFNTDAPVCATGLVPSDIFHDSFESGTGNWTLSAPRWQQDSPNGAFAHSGVHFLYADDLPEAVADVSATMSSSVSVPSGTYLHFAHAYDFEYYVDDENWYDGGVLEYSTDDGSTWNDAGSLLDHNLYDGVIYGGYAEHPEWDNPLKSRSAFVGTSHGYISSRANLATLAGQNVKFRWRMGLDVVGFSWGWWLDDVRIYRCVSRPRVDFDADSINDMAYFHPATGLWAVLRSAQNFSYASPQFITWGQAGDIVVPGDYDGDGMVDPAVRRPPGGGQSAAYLILKSSTGYDYGSSLTIPAGWPGLGDTPVIGDYNGDGFSDPAIWRGNTGVWIIPMSPLFNTYQFYAWGATGDTPVGADVDGDGQTDIGYWRPSTGVWGFLQSSQGYSYGSPLFFSWGTTGDLPVMADYDGDALADPAVVIPPASGQSRAYRILLSTMSYSLGSSITIPAGWPGLGDTPVPLDFDGDGKADAGIWRNNTGVWIIPKSSTNNTTYMFAAWGASGDVVVR